MRVTCVSPVRMPQDSRALWGRWGGVEVFGDRCRLPVDDAEDADLVTLVMAAVAGPGVGGPFGDGILAVGDDPANVLRPRHLLDQGAASIFDSVAHFGLWRK
jgi:hypothetical protein